MMAWLFLLITLLAIMLGILIEDTWHEWRNQ